MSYEFEVDQYINLRNTTGGINGAGLAYPSGARLSMEYPKTKVTIAYYDFKIST
jgi:hypothetical protein